MSFTTKQQQQTSFQREAEKAAALAGLTAEEKAAIEQAARLAEAEAKVLADAPPKEKRKFILQEITVDSRTVLRRRVLLTPSMCRHRGCGYDAAKDCGYANGWGDAEVDLILPGGKTIGERMLEILSLHVQTQHAAPEAHIIDEDELARQKAWGRAPTQFLTNPARP